MPDRITLGFDTSAAHCAAALLRGNAVLAVRHEPMAKGQAERLMPMLEEMLAEAGLGWRDLDVIGVGTGPGNFTGIRVAVAAARGLALSLRIPAVGVGAPEALAWGLARPCRVVITGKGDMVLFQDFAEGAGGRPQQAATGALPPGPAPAAPAVGIAEGVAGDPQPRPAPVYLRPADAAPARDAPPVILA
ncbi:tRNA (adenosine(37)-N6)-threonylcarbamoyltransferase complex dimerization subunit type 1 TsaB [Paracoccus sp. SCN 68-21]|uniref:tRNA (adenosine(37)-N6)-threonylcarbamoyltransferase complex dimerization subunit type 1 TsaB n=1 Tax=Paracoccus sp. SCN 68-21 TaxID=1660154 RepID=UPI0008688FED|nr:tRNA (adenosine(37)-N6)-threonylcarbamoyltransferase complex dimerization subunit type 1 TsaB [Paracoccus sp. SCN 68-21]ODT59941.1 MAG: tRNA (adenosine(37)-N6)-threonylcarbamoyltransferase complex dimerization subunit type 1 TsaB [Paracoccus sp. SCN 68-21]